MKRTITAVLIVTSLVVIAPVRAQIINVWDRFLSPSGNIFCEVIGFTGQTAAMVRLSCGINQSSARLPPKPTDCKLIWGKYFDINARGKAIRSCGETTQFNPNVPFLPYGEVWQVGGFRCDATTVRVRCVNLDKHGFELSRARQVLF